MKLLFLRLILCNESEIIPSFKNFTILTAFFYVFGVNVHDEEPIESKCLLNIDDCGQNGDHFQN